MTVWLDMDDVLADFTLGYEHLTGERLVIDKVGPDWSLVNEVPFFFATLRPVADAYMLEHFVRHFTQGSYGVLTALPQERTQEVEHDKRDWLWRFFPSIPRAVMVYPGEEKSKFCRAGDVLIDDWPSKHKHVWEAAGGRFIHHTSAASSIRQLRSPHGVH